MTNRQETNFDTLCSHAGQRTRDGDSLVPPIVQSTTFSRSHVGSDCTHQYSRVSNPTVTALEDELGRLEDACPAVTFTTGLAAETALFLSLLKAGDHVICGRSVYGGTTRILQQIFADLQIQVTFVDSRKTERISEALQANTKLVFIETPSNPTLDLSDIASIAETCHRYGALLAVDNTFLTPVLQQPLALGADISVYSTTKFIEGHSIALGGALVSNNEDLNERFRFIRKSTGAIQTPFNAWLTLQGLRTLPLRIRHQSKTAETVAEWLDRQPEVERVYYPSLESGSTLKLANTQHLGHHGAVVSFEVAGGLEGAKRFTENLFLFRLVEHVGSIETLVTHSATMTHADVPQAERLKAGVKDGLLRLSIGLESIGDITQELKTALQAVSEEKRSPSEGRNISVQPKHGEPKRFSSQIAA